ncbi:MULTISPECIES: S9 family peptidase [unclassified Pseudomonas]|uniref:alpha/beta hydrolase family protein n=1 Tax=unclassified Pseudomonas TaxID=196821 RepID=UPI0015A3CD50|nr:MULTISPECIES: alpha/beta hydrolase [unclassified Pseudomonas]NWC95580.1 alpha/beta hydrolase [Pseudomonas sp. IPO3779]NWD19778.1 alpha/beta hydrolase [Pseudomonas sp. IPO3778]
MLLCAGVPGVWALGDDSTPLLWNTPADQATCNQTDSSLWVELAGGDECIRYFAGAVLSHAPVVIAMFHGDRNVEMHRSPESIRGNTLAAKVAQAKALSRRAGVPVVIVARPGTYGSSGNHGQRRQAREFIALDGALNELRKRYSIGQFVLLGHSGGATVAAALLTLGRTDVKCAVMTSGAFALVQRAQMLRQTQGLPSRPGRDTNGLLHPYDPVEHIAGIAVAPARPLFVIGSVDDQVTPFGLQERFFQGLVGAGHHAQLVKAQGVPAAFHQLRNDIGLKTAAGCAG